MRHPIRDFAILALLVTTGATSAWAGRDKAIYFGDQGARHYEISTESAEGIHYMVLSEWEKYSVEQNVFVKEFDGGIELRATGRNKGFAVNSILAELNTGIVVAYMGDDYTDEDAFQALKGKGCCVLVRSELRETAADLWLQPPEELLWFLSKWNDCLQVDPPIS